MQTSGLFYIWQLGRGFLKKKEQTCEPQVRPFHSVLG